MIMGFPDAGRPFCEYLLIGQSPHDGNAQFVSSRVSLRGATPRGGLVAAPRLRLGPDKIAKRTMWGSALPS